MHTGAHKIRFFDLLDKPSRVRDVQQHVGAQEPAMSEFRLELGHKQDPSNIPLAPVQCRPLLGCDPSLHSAAFPSPPPGSSPTHIILPSRRSSSALPCGT